MSIFSRVTDGVGSIVFEKARQELSPPVVVGSRSIPQLAVRYQVMRRRREEAEDIGWLAPLGIGAVIGAIFVFVCHFVGKKNRGAGTRGDRYERQEI